MLLEWMCKITQYPSVNGNFAFSINRRPCSSHAAIFPALPLSLFGLTFADSAGRSEGHLCFQAAQCHAHPRGLTWNAGGVILSGYVRGLMKINDSAQSA